MELVVDTNVVFSALIAEGQTREIIITENLDLSVPEFFLNELRNHSDAVEDKSGLERHELEMLLNLVVEQVRVIPREEFEAHLDEARDLIGDVDPDDVPFLALALHLGADIWSDDEHFQAQDAVKAWRTHELIERLQ